MWQENIEQQKMDHWKTFSKQAQSFRWKIPDWRWVNEQFGNCNEKLKKANYLPEVGELSTINYSCSFCGRSGDRREGEAVHMWRIYKRIFHKNIRASTHRFLKQTRNCSENFLILAATAVSRLAVTLQTAFYFNFTQMYCRKALNRPANTSHFNLFQSRPTNAHCTSVFCGCYK